MSRSPNDRFSRFANTLSPYNARGTRNVLDTTDGIYNSLSTTQKDALTLATTPDGNGGYNGVISLGVQIG